MTFTATEVIMFLIALSVVLTLSSGFYTLYKLKNLPIAGAEDLENEPRGEHEAVRGEVGR